MRPRIFELFGPHRRRFSWRAEITAGLTVGLIALPLSLALGIAGIPAGIETPYPAPALGIFTAIIAGLVISVFGGSRVQIGGPTAAFVPIIVLIVMEHGYAGLVVATMMAGVLLVFMGLARMGALIKFIPWPVTSGFTSGIAVAIMITQIPDALGFVGVGSMPREFYEKVPWLIEHLGGVDFSAVAVGVVSLAIILVWPRLKLQQIPGSIVAMVVVTVAVAVLAARTNFDVATVGSKFGGAAIPSALPAPRLPAISWRLVQDLIGPAVAIAVLGAIESLLSAVVADGLSGDRHDSNMELVAQGMANILCPFFGGLPATGAIARTSANVNNGGTTPLAGIFHALTMLVVVLVAARWAAFIPMATVSAVLVAVALRMGEWHQISRLTKMPRSDALVLVVTFALTVVFDLVVAVQVGMVLAAVLFIKRVADTTQVGVVGNDDVLERPEHVAQGKTVPPGVLVYRIFGPFMFGAAEKMEDALQMIERWPQVLILRMNLVTAMDMTGMNALKSIVERAKHHQGVVVISGLHQQPLAMLRKAGFVATIGDDNVCDDFDAALRRAAALVVSPP